MSYWNGDEWRWHVGRQRTPRVESMYVIESVEKEPAKGRKVPFGFSPRDAEPKPVEFIDWLDVAP